MAAKQKKSAYKIVEYIFIIAFLVIVLLLISISSYRAIINSDWYQLNSLQKNFNEQIKNIQSKKAIENIQIMHHGNGDFDVYENFDRSLFDNITCENLALNPERRDINASKYTFIIFYTDKSYNVFSVTELNEFYLGDYKIECPELNEWFLTEVIN